MANLSTTYLYRMTHVDNVAHIMSHGITHRNSVNANPNYTPIGDSTLINSRDSFRLDIGQLLGDYIPFYLGVRMPMLYVIQKGFNGVAKTAKEDIVYCVCSVQNIIDENLPFVFTDGHAMSNLTTQFDATSVNSISNIVDYKAIKIRDWINPNDLDLKRRMEAEFLVLGDIPYSRVSGFIVQNAAVQAHLVSIGVSKRIKVSPNAYF